MRQAVPGTEPAPCICGAQSPDPWLSTLRPLTIWNCSVSRVFRAMQPWSTPKTMSWREFPCSMVSRAMQGWGHNLGPQACLSWTSALWLTDPPGWDLSLLLLNAVQDTFILLDGTVFLVSLCSSSLHAHKNATDFFACEFWRCHFTVLFYPQYPFIWSTEIFCVYCHATCK